MIKDSPFNIDEIKSKRRYEIKKGDKNYNVILIDYEKLYEELFVIYKASSMSFPEYRRSHFNRDNFNKSFENMEDDGFVFGAFSNIDGSLKGYAQLRRRGRYIGFISLRVDVAEEKNNINFAIVHEVLNYFKDDLSNGSYIDDGARVVIHTTTHFQDYLEKYFGFRKAYSKLHIKYRFPFGIMVRIFYPFRKLVKKNNRLLNLIDGVFIQEEIVRHDHYLY
ncbi:hypothetical protein SAMN05216349_13119 [Oribacterium sp. KHPX15]|nr:hypothetical protein SAMN05216349_13119 [Oribacterium sp. KHPX15]